MPLLTNIRLHLPAKDESFEKQLIGFLAPVGQPLAHGISLDLSNEAFLPKTSLVFEADEHPYASFELDDGEPIKINIANTTSIDKQSAYHYSHISLEDFIRRMDPYPLHGLDHTGFNLPYFTGIHPTLLELRRKLKDACLYHTFPKHLEDAPWDFIIPGSRDEIARSRVVDYQQTRKPKFEIVSFDDCSTPLIQIDIQVDGKYEDMKTVFPEAIHEANIRNMWVYIQNDSGIDICFVLNEVSRHDWSHEFRNERVS